MWRRSVFSAGAGALACGYYFAECSQTTLTMMASSREETVASQVASRCPTLTRRYYPCPLLVSGTLQTLCMDRRLGTGPAKCRDDFTRQMVITPDGGTLALDHFVPKQCTADTKTIVIFPGVWGGWQSGYLRRFLTQANEEGWRCVIFTRRGCGDLPLTSPCPMDYGDTEDTAHAMAALRARLPHAPLVALGYSLGSNFVCNFLGGCPDHSAGLLGGVVVANPWNLVGLSYWLDFAARKESFVLVHKLKQKLTQHREQLESSPTVTIDVDRLVAPWPGSYRDITLEVQRPHFLPNGTLDTYLQDASSAYHMPQVVVPLLSVNARDDRVCPNALVPKPVFAENPNLVHVETTCGGHHGYYALNPLKGPGADWLNTLILEWLGSVLQQHSLSLEPD